MTTTKYLYVPMIALLANLLAGCAFLISTPQSHGIEDVIFPTPSSTVEPDLSSARPSTTDMPTEQTPDSTDITGQHPFYSERAKRDYLLFLPDTYGEYPQKDWPLIIFLHGSGVRGDNVHNLKYEALPQILEFVPEFPFIVISPLLTDESGDELWTTEKVVSSLLIILEEVQAEYAVDPNRIYLTGVSLGGNGTWEIGLRYPDRFAALVPVMGFYGNTTTARVPDNICDLKDVPVWAFHGAKDHIVPLFAEEELVDALKACGGKVQFTIYPDGDHDVSGQTYMNTDLYEWLQNQSLK
jgi:predicted peptidase